MSVEKCVQEILLTVRRLENAIDENQRRPSHESTIEAKHDCSAHFTHRNTDA